MNISVIVTVLNEGQAMHRLLSSLSTQTRPADEIVIVDGGSSDETVAIIQSYSQTLPITLLIAPGANISRGRNIAIATAKGPIIASTDAGVRLSPQWLAQLLAPFEGPNPPQVVAGFFLPDAVTTFEVAMGATVLPQVADINPDTFLPSSRSVAFSKIAWEAAGRYPEWLDFCEDLVFDIKLKGYAKNFVFQPQALVYFRPRGSLKSFFKQYYQYARGDGKADLWRLRHAIRYGTYLIGVPALFLAWRWQKLLGFLGVLVAFRGLFYTAYRRLPRLWSRLPWSEKLKALAWIPLIRIVGDVAKMLGYPVGVLWRLKGLSSDARLRWR